LLKVAQGLPRGGAVPCLGAVPCPLDLSPFTLLKIQTLESLKIGRTALSAEDIDLLRAELSSVKIDFRGIDRRTTKQIRILVEDEMSCRMIPTCLAS